MVTTIIVIIAIILAGITGGVYYYQTLDKKTGDVAQVTNPVEEVSPLVHMLISPSSIFKIVSKYLTNVKIEEKAKQVQIKKTTRIINIKFRISPHSNEQMMILKDTIELLPLEKSANLPDKNSEMEEYVNGNGIRLTIVKKAGNSGLVMPSSSLWSVSEDSHPMIAKGHQTRKIKITATNPYEPIEIYGYINKGKLLIHTVSTLSTANIKIDRRENKEEFLRTLYPVLQKVRSEIQKEQLEKINNLSF